MHEGHSRLWCCQKVTAGSKQKNRDGGRLSVTKGHHYRDPFIQAGSLRKLVAKPSWKSAWRSFPPSQQLSTIVWSISWSKHSGGAVTCSLCCSHTFGVLERKLQSALLPVFPVWGLESQRNLPNLPDGPYIVVEKTHSICHVSQHVNFPWDLASWNIPQSTHSCLPTTQGWNGWALGP